MKPAHTPVQEITVTQMNAELNTNPDLFLIDVREDEEWQAGHIPQATHIARGNLEYEIEKAVPHKDSEIILYCGGGYRSALAADTLQRMGYSHVYSLAGGIKAWVDANLPIEV